MTNNSGKWEKINSTTADIGDLVNIKWFGGGRFSMVYYSTGRVLKHSKNRIFIECYYSNQASIDEIPYTKIESCNRKIETDTDLGI